MIAPEIHPVVRMSIVAVELLAVVDSLAHSTADVVLSNDDDDWFIPALIGFGVGLYAMYSGIDKYRKSRLIKDTPTEQIRSMAVGRTELEGTAHEIGKPYSQPFVDDDCLYASWEIEEYTSSGSNRGKSWSTVESGAYTEPFLLEDETGEVVVDATADATWELTGEQTRRWTVDSRSQPRSDIVNFCNYQDISPTASNKRRYTQTVLPPQTSVYVLGESTPRDLSEDDDLFEKIDLTDAGQRLKIERDDGSGRFIISDMNEDEIATYYSRRAPFYVFGGLLLSTVCLYVLLTYLV